jgi:hypothetical protein
MSKGSKIIPFRIPSELLAEMESVIAGRNSRAKGEPWGRTGFVIAAIREKISKMQRSRSGGKPRSSAHDQVAGDGLGGES